MITVPVPVMRGLLAQPRATVQVDRWNGRETGPDHGVKRQGPNGFPPTSIMTDLPDTGTHNHKRSYCEERQPSRATDRSRGMGPGFRQDDCEPIVLYPSPHSASTPPDALRRPPATPAAPSCSGPSRN